MNSFNNQPTSEHQDNSVFGTLERRLAEINVTVADDFDTKDGEQLRVSDDGKQIEISRKLLGILERRTCTRNIQKSKPKLYIKALLSYLKDNQYEKNSISEIESIISKNQNQDSVENIIERGIYLDNQSLRYFLNDSGIKPKHSILFNLLEDGEADYFYDIDSGIFQFKASLLDNFSEQSGGRCLEYQVVDFLIKELGNSLGNETKAKLEQHKQYLTYTLGRRSITAILGKTGLGVASTASGFGALNLLANLGIDSATDEVRKGNIDEIIQIFRDLLPYELQAGHGEHSHIETVKEHLINKYKLDPNPTHEKVLEELERRILENYEEFYELKQHIEHNIKKASVEEIAEDVTASAERIFTNAEIRKALSEEFGIDQNLSEAEFQTKFSEVLSKQRDQLTEVMHEGEKKQVASIFLKLENALSSFLGDAKQAVYDFAGLFYFGRTIAPNFLEGSGHIAVGDTAPFILGYLLVSNKETVDETIHEIGAASLSVGQMAALVHVVQGSHFDYEQNLNESIQNKFGPKINTLQDNDSLKTIIEHFGINVVNGGKKEYVLFNNEEDHNIEVSQDVFIEILPYLANPQNHNDIIDILSDYLYSKTQKDGIRDYLAEKINILDTEKINSLNEDTTINDQINQSITEIIEYEVHELAWFFIVCQPLFGLGLTTSANAKIQQVSNKIKYLAISKGMTPSDASELQTKFIGKTIESLPNRFAFFSDLGPFMAALSLNGWTGIWNMINSMLPIVAVNVSPYFNDINSILEEANPSYKKSSEKGIKNKAEKGWEYTKDHVFSNVKVLGKILGSLTENDLLDAFPGAKGMANNIQSFVYSLTGNKSQTVQSQGKTAIQSGANIRKFGKDYSLEDIKKIDKTPEILNNVESVLGELEGTTSVIQNNTYGFKNIVDITGYLIEYYDSASDTDKQKISEIFQKYSHLFIILQQQTHISFGNSKKDELVRIQNILHERFSHTQHDTAKKGQEYTDSKLDWLISELEETADFGTLTITQSQLHREFGDNAYNLELCLRKDIHKYGSVKALKDVVDINVQFLLKLEQSNVGHNLKEKLIENFISNLYRSEQKSAEALGADQSRGKMSLACKTLYRKTQDGEVKEFLKSISEKMEDSISSQCQDISANFEITNEDKNSAANPADMKKARKIYEENKGVFGSVFGTGYYQPFEEFIKMAEDSLGMDIFEIIQMILLVQTPFVPAISNSIKRAIKGLRLIPGMNNQYAQEYIIGVGTYIISMFADNYVGLIVGAKLCKEILGYEAGQAVEAMVKYSIYGGSKVVTGNSPNVLMKGEYGGDFYFNKSLNTSNQTEDDNLAKKGYDTFAKALGKEGATDDEKKGFAHTIFGPVFTQIPGYLPEILDDTIGLFLIRMTFTDMVEFAWDTFTPGANRHSMAEAAMTATGLGMQYAKAGPVTPTVNTANDAYYNMADLYKENKQAA